MSTGKLLGASTNGTGNDATGYAFAQRFQCLATGILSSLLTYCLVNSNVRLAIYADSSGAIGSLLGESASTAVTSGAWREVSLASNVNVTKDTYYWLAVQNQTAGGCSYWSSSGTPYKRYTQSYGAFPSSVSWTDITDVGLAVQGYGILTLAPTAIATAAAHGSPRLIFKIAPSGIASLEAFGSPTVTRAGNYITPSGITSLAAFGSPAVINRQILAPSGVASAFASGSPAVVLRVQIVAPSGIASAFAAGSPGLYMGHITCTGILSCEAFGAVMVLRDRIHLILEGSYEIDSQAVNRSYVVGQDLSGAAVTASAITQAEVDLVGERLEVQHTPEAVTSAVAGYMAANVLAKARLGSKKGVITIPPHCGMELWDVVYIYDEYGNQSANYRVASYVFEYSVLESRWQHQIELCAP